MKTRGIFRKLIRVVVICIVSVIVLVNVFPYLSAFNVYWYCNRDASFQFEEVPSQGRGLKLMEADWKEFKDSTHRDTVLYRTFTIQPLHFWMWRSYLFNRRYRYPYLEDTAVTNQFN